MAVKEMYWVTDRLDEMTDSRGQKLERPSSEEEARKEAQTRIKRGVRTEAWVWKRIAVYQVKVEEVEEDN